MSVSVFGRYVLSSCAAAAILSGCGGSQPPVGALGAMPQSQSTLPGANLRRRGSWMLPEAKSEDLLYANVADSKIHVYSYPGGKHVGTLTGIATANMCSDQLGDVFITSISSQIFEYAHGGTSPIATLSDGPYSPAGCSVDPTTGNLAVANSRGPGSRGFGNVAIFQNAQGTPTFYSDPNIYWYYNCGYDDSGNLFVDGNNESFPAPFAELPKGSSTFTDITLSKGLADWGPIYWDGKGLGVGWGDNSHTTIYQVAVSGSTGTVVAATTLQMPQGPHRGISWQFWLQGHTVLAPYTLRRSHYRNIGFWHFPAGGATFNDIRAAPRTVFFAVTVSIAPR